MAMGMAVMHSRHPRMHPRVVSTGPVASIVPIVSTSPVAFAGPVISSVPAVRARVLISISGVAAAAIVSSRIPHRS